MRVDLLSQLDQALSNQSVDILTFAEDSRFCGKVLYPRQKLLLKLIFLMDLTDEEERILEYWEAGGRNGTEIQISPKIRERVRYLKESGFPHFQEIVLVGGRRSSKGFLTGIALAYKIYQLLQYEDPLDHFGVDHAISFSVIAAAQDQAAKQQYADLSSTVNSCAALQPYLFKLQELEFSLLTRSDQHKMEMWKNKDRRAQRLKDISSVYGNALPANARTIRGATTMAYCFDEVGHFMQGENDQADTEVYAAARPSMSQFGRHAIIFLNSSPYSKTGILYQHFMSAMELTEVGDPLDPTAFAIRFPSWSLYEGFWESEEAVTKGIKKCQHCSPDWDPGRKKEDGDLFYTEDDRYGILQSRNEERKNPEKFKVENRAYFAEVLDAYLNPESVDRMFRGVPTSDGLEYTSLSTNFNSSSNELQYRAHFDPASTTAGFAFALGHVDELVIAGKKEEHVIFDILRRWDPEDFPDSTISWEPILEEILFWIDIFRPFEVTTDCHQSAFPISWLNREISKHKLGETRVFAKPATAQLNWNRAETFKTALYRGLIHAPFDTSDAEWTAQELKNLQVTRTARIPHVDHPDVGPVQTSDCYDAVSYVVEAFMGNKFARANRDAFSEEIRLGAPGGYAGSRVTPRPAVGRDGEPLGRSKGATNKKLAKSRSATRSYGATPKARPLRG